MTHTFLAEEGSKGWGVRGKERTAWQKTGEATGQNEADSKQMEGLFLAVFCIPKSSLRALHKLHSEESSAYGSACLPALMLSTCKIK